MSAILRANTSRHRFDEARRFTGVYQRMGQVGLDADWNEEVMARTADARRRTADLAEGSPDDGFRIAGDFLVDPITSIAGWTGTRLPPADYRSQATPELRLDRRDGDTLPWVVRSRWHTAVRRALPAPVDLTRVIGGGVEFTASHVVFELRLERLPADDELVNTELFLDDGTIRAVPASGFLTPKGWQRVAVPVGLFTGLDPRNVVAWGLRGLPPMSPIWIGGLRAVDPGLGTDVVIAGGDGSLAGAGRMLVDGVRTFLERDLRYSQQPDFPGAEPLPAVTDDTKQHGFYLDVWEQTVTGLDDPSLLEPALDGVETGARLRLVTQVRAWPAVAAGALPALPAPTGRGRLTTNIPAGALPDRDPPEPLDPCRDRCLASENVSTGEGYIGGDNLHVRIEVLRAVRQSGSGIQEDVILWSRDNGSTAMRLVQNALASATSIKVAPADAARLRAGDIIVIEDRATRLRWDAPSPAVVRRLRGVATETGVLELDDAGQLRTDGLRQLDLGGPLGRDFTVAGGAQVRRWDGADLLVTGVRYRLSDGLTFALSSTGFRSGDYWTFTARIHAADGAAKGVVDQLSDALPHGPVHRYVVLGRATRATVGSGNYTYEDLRPRFLPLTQVRDRLRELGDRNFGPGTFTIVIGDGVRTFGDIDQAIALGITGDEALQIALDRLRGGGGSVFLRAGTYQLEQPVLVHEHSSIRILGDGDATRVEARGAGGVFHVDRCGLGGAVSIEDLTLIEDPEAEVEVPAPDPLTRLELLLANRVAPKLQLDARLLLLSDVDAVPPPPDFAQLYGTALRAGILPGAGRASGSVVATLAELRRLQREGEGVLLEDNPAAIPLLAAIDALPHGVITVADSRDLTIRNCAIESRREGNRATGIMVTGTCRDLDIVGCTVRAATGVAALPYAPYVAPTFLLAFPRAGLVLDGLRLADSRILGRGPAPTGVHVADGNLRGVEIRDNEIAGFAVGVLIEDVAESVRDVADDRLRVSGNRIAADIVGVQLSGDGIDLADNEIALAPLDAGAEPALSAGVIAAGQALRITGSWITLPDPGAASPLALTAGIVVGDGLDDGGSSRAVSDVEVAGNRIEGPGASNTAAGIVIGGPQPIFDVRVHGNVIRNLGDAGVRSFSTSAPIGRLTIEGNRVERVALGDPATQFANLPMLTRLWPSGASTLGTVDVTRPRPLLQALVASSATSVRPALDAALRWVERLTLRGAIALGAVEGAVVARNRIAEVGRTDPYAEPSIDGAAIRMAAIAAVAGSEVTVEDNEIEAIHAPFQRLDGGGDDDGDGRPDALELLDLIGLASDPRLDRADVHLTVANLRARLLEYAQADVDQRGALARTLFGPLDAVTGELAGLGGRAAALVETIRRETGDLRVATTDSAQLLAAISLRATLSQAASATAGDAVARDAWDAASQLDLALAGGNPSAIAETASRLERRVQDLAAGLPSSFGTDLSKALRGLASTPEDPKTAFNAAKAIGRIGAMRDAQVRSKDLPTATELVGPRKTVVGTFTESASKILDGIEVGGSANAERIAQLRTAKDALVRELQQVHGPLALDVEADYRDVDRTAGNSEPAVARMRDTLKKVISLAKGEPLPEGSATTEAARAAAQAVAGSLHLYAKSIDKQISGLLEESPDSVEKSLRSFGIVMKQLEMLTEDDPSVRDLAKLASNHIEDARSSADKRGYNLQAARTQLGLLRGKLLPVLPQADEVRVVIQQHRRIAALAAVVIDLATMDPAFRTEALNVFATHLDRAQTLLHADAGAHTNAELAIENARGNLGGSPAARDQAIYGLASVVSDTAALARGADETSAGVAAVGVLAIAVTAALNPQEDRATRLVRVQTHLRGRTAQVSAALAAQIDAQTDLTPAVVLIRAALDRLARDEQLAPSGQGSPQFDVEPDAADGVFVAGPRVRARVAGNRVSDAVAGVTVAGAIGHLVTEPPDDGAVIEIAGNRLTACAVSGLEIRTDGQSTVTVWDNHVLGCGGAAVEGTDAWGQAVLEIAGAGELIVRGNVLAENGNRATRTLLHELVVDWRGEASVRGNTVRHLGGGAGGAGVLILAEPVAATLIAQLARTPFLGVEPAPQPAGPGRSPSSILLPKEALPPLALSAAAGKAVALGNLRQVDLQLPTVHRALAFTTPVRTAPPIATQLAASYLDRVRPFIQLPLVDFLRRPPIKIVPPIALRPQHSIQVEGNDISAHGPALLMLCEGTTVWAATVVGNELRSIGRAGVVYLRRTDSTVFSSNRCQNLEVVNNVVVRAGKAPITLAGNVILGAEPVTPKPKLEAARDDSAVSLNVGVGAGSLAIPLDPRVLLGNLERKRVLAGDLFSELLADVLEGPAQLQVVEGAKAEAEQVADAVKAVDAKKADAVKAVDAKKAAERAMEKGEVAKPVAEKVALDSTLEPRLPFPTPSIPTRSLPGTLTSPGGRTGPLSSQLLDNATREALRAALPVGVSPRIGSRTVYGNPDAEDTPTQSLQKLVQRVTIHAPDPAAAKQMLGAALSAAQGDPTRALALVDQDVLGLEESAPAIKESVTNSSLIAEALADHLAATVAPPKKPPIQGPPIVPVQPPPPDPSAHSLVIVGGSHVAVVGNATTAGVLVLEADRAVELNA